MEDLIKKAKSGDKLAFTELMLQMQDELYKIAKIRLKNDDDVFDVIQDTMLSTYKSLKKLKHNEYFKTWIIKILINECNKKISILTALGDYSTKMNLSSLEQDSNPQKIDFKELLKNLYFF